MTFIPSVPTPRLDAAVITVGMLFNQLITFFLEEPRRLDMGEWVSRLDGVHRSFDPEDEDENETDDLPACGTVGCIAGWGLVFLRPPVDVHPQVLHALSEEIMDQAIGYNDNGYRTVGDLFVANWSNLDKESAVPRERSEFPDAGTPEQAAVVVRRIRRYMELHPEVLDREIPVAEIHARLIAKMERTSRA